MKTAAIIIAVGVSVVHAADISPLIYGGTEVPAGTKTYTVGLRYTAIGSDFCGGTLISPTHVLSAAHCAGRAKFVAVGTHFNSGSQDGERIAVKKETPHPSYNAKNITHDYSIIELATPATFTPIPLYSADSETFVGKNATVMGWGSTRLYGSSKVLLRVDVPVLSDAACKAAKLTNAPISATMVCAGGEKGKDSCQGDSGGPLILERTSGDVLVGVVSWGDGCGVAGKPGVYSKPNVVKSWIQSLAPTATWV